MIRSCREDSWRFFHFHDLKPLVWFAEASFDHERNEKVQTGTSPYPRWGLPKQRPVVQTAGAVGPGGEVVHGRVQQTRASLTSAGLSAALPPGTARPVQHASSLLQKHQRPNQHIILEASASRWVLVLSLWCRKEDIRNVKEEAYTNILNIR